MISFFKRHNFLLNLFFPLVFVMLLWGIKGLEEWMSWDFKSYTLYPRTATGLLGIVTGPLIHGNLAHLFSNSIPLLFLGTIMFYFYRPIAFQIFFWVYLMTGLWVWAAARESYHLGASGIVYGFLTFLFFSGLFRRDVKLFALSLLVTFLYGGMVWGVLPINEDVSWESHFLGSVAGITCAFFFRNEGPQRSRYEWEDEEDDDITSSDEPNNDQPGQPKIVYFHTSSSAEKRNGE